MRSDEIANERFRTTVYTPGYELQEVDRFLDQAVAALRHHEGGLAAREAPLDARTVEEIRFTPTRYRSGYHPEDVDAFLERLARAFHEHEHASAEYHDA